MNTYIALMNLTDQGVRTMQQSVERSIKGKALMKRLGGRIKAYRMTMGQYDFVVVFECPDDESMAKFLLAVGAWGAVRSSTLKAFPVPTYRRILHALPALEKPAPKRRRGRRRAARR